MFILLRELEDSLIFSLPLLSPSSNLTLKILFFFLVIWEMFELSDSSTVNVIERDLEALGFLQGHVTAFMTWREELKYTFAFGSCGRN